MLCTKLEKRYAFHCFYTYGSWFLFSFAVKTNLMAHLMCHSQKLKNASKHCSWCAFATMVKTVRFGSVMLIKSCARICPVRARIPYQKLHIMSHFVESICY